MWTRLNICIIFTILFGRWSVHFVIFKSLINAVAPQRRFYCGTSPATSRFCFTDKRMTELFWWLQLSQVFDKKCERTIINIFRLQLLIPNKPMNWNFYFFKVLTETPYCMCSSESNFIMKYPYVIQEIISSNYRPLKHIFGPIAFLNH